MTPTATFGGCAAPAPTDEQVPYILAHLWEIGVFTRADGDSPLWQIGQDLQRQFGLSADDLRGREWVTGIWPGEAACRRLLGAATVDRLVPVAEQGA